MLALFGAHIQKRIYIKLKWFREGQLDGHKIPSSVTQMQNELGLRSLEQRRADARVIMLFKIVHGLVAIPLPSYFEQPSRMTRRSNPLALRQIHTSVNHYKYSFFPAADVYWNKLPSSVVTLPMLDQFSVAVRSLDHPMF